jgi:hypothetical protein
MSEEVDISKAEAEVKEQDKVSQLESELSKYKQQEQERIEKEKQEEEERKIQEALQKQKEELEESFNKKFEEVSMRMSKPSGGGEETDKEELRKKYFSDPEFRAKLDKEALKAGKNMENIFYD